MHTYHRRHDEVVVSLKPPPSPQAHSLRYITSAHDDPTKGIPDASFRLQNRHREVSWVLARRKTNDGASEQVETAKTKGREDDQRLKDTL